MFSGLSIFEYILLAIMGLGLLVLIIVVPYYIVLCTQERKAKTAFWNEISNVLKDIYTKA
jgi:uncharacterized membrane protein YqjE